jgi:hypothetical protein
VPHDKVIIRGTPSGTDLTPINVVPPSFLSPILVKIFLEGKLMDDPFRPKRQNQVRYFEIVIGIPTSETSVTVA